MKRAAWMLAIGFGCTAMVAAQSGSSQPSGSQQSGTITVTGCLQHGDMAGATGTSGSTGGTSTAGTSASRSTSGSGNAASFILTNATMGSSSSHSGSSTSGTAAGSTAGAAAGGATSSGSTGTSGSTYILEPGSAESELTSNTNKKVEVTGTLDTSMSHSGTSTPSSAGATSSGSTASSAAGSTGSASGSMANAQHLKVSSVRVIGESCR